MDFMRREESMIAVDNYCCLPNPDLLPNRRPRSGLFQSRTISPIRPTAVFLGAFPRSLKNTKNAVSTRRTSNDAKVVISPDS